MQQLQEAVMKKLAEPEHLAAWVAATGGTPEECPPIYSFDNPSIHLNNHAYLVELGLAKLSAPGAPLEPTDAWLPLPPYSGDLHRTIERVHARVCGQFQRWVNTSTTARTMEGYCTKLADIFNTTQTADVISACMGKKNASLPDLYRKVVELGGGKAPRPYC